MEGNTKATKTRLGPCQRGLGSYKVWRAVRPLNNPLLMTEIRLLFKYLSKHGMSKNGDTRMMSWDGVISLHVGTKGGRSQSKKRGGRVLEMEGGGWERLVGVWGRELRNLSKWGKRGTMGTVVPG